MALFSKNKKAKQQPTITPPGVGNMTTPPGLINNRPGMDYNKNLQQFPEMGQPPQPPIPPQPPQHPQAPAQSPMQDNQHPQYQQSPMQPPIQGGQMPPQPTLQGQYNPNQKQPMQPPMQQQLQQVSKNKKSGGLFSGLFGKKGKQQPQNQQPSNTMRPPQPPQPPRGIAMGMPPQQGVPIQGGQPIQNGLSNNNPMQRPNNGITLQGFAEIINPMNGNVKTLEQYVFFYANMARYNGILQFYTKEFTNVGFVGINQANLLKSEFDLKKNVGNILLFVETAEEFNNMTGFLIELVKIKLQNPTHHTINFVIPKDFDTSLLTTITDLGRVIYIYRSKQVEDFSNVPAAFLQQVMIKVIEHQPTYLDEEEKIELPTEATKKEIVSASNLFDLNDKEKIDEEIRLLRASTNQDTEDDIIEMLKTRLSNVTSPDDIKHIAETIPDIKVMEDYLEELDNYTKLLQDTPNLDNTNLQLAIIDKLEVTQTQGEVMSRFVDKLVSMVEVQVQKRAMTVETNLREGASKQESDKKAIEESLTDKSRQESIEKLKIDRENLKIKIDSDFKNYKESVMLLSSALALKSEFLQAKQESINKLIGENLDVLPTELIETSSNLIKIIEENKAEAYKRQVQLNENYHALVNYSKELLQSYNILVHLDDLIINLLEEENESIRKNKTYIVQQVESPLKVTTRLFISNDGGVLAALANSWLRISDILITTIAEAPQNKNTQVRDFETFISEDISVSKNVGKVLITQSDFENYDKFVNNLMLLKDKLNIISSKNLAARMVFLLRPEDVQLINFIKEYAANTLISTSTEKDTLIETNKINRMIEESTSSMITNLFIQSKPASNVVETSSEIRALTGITDRIKEYYLTYKDRSKEDIVELISFLARE